MKSFIRFALLTILILSSEWANALIFSVAPASPLIKGNVTPDDILGAGPTGPLVVKQGSSMGLQDDFSSGSYDNLDAVTKGDDIPPWSPLYFSVDRLAIGLPGVQYMIKLN